MSIRPVNQYRFECDAMRYTDSSRKFLELCEGNAIFSGEDEEDAQRVARDAGWCVPGWSAHELVCPFHSHGMMDGTVWPRESDCVERVDQ